MNTKLFFGACLLAMMACCAVRQPVNKQPASSIHCVQIRQLFPVNKLEGKRSIFMHHDTGYAYIYTYKNQMIIQSTYHFDSAFDEKMEPAYRALKYTTLVFTKGAKYASFTDEFHQLYDVQVNADSAREEAWPVTLLINYKIFVDTNFVMFRSSGIIEGSDTLKEIYTVKHTSDTTITGVIELYYTAKVPGIAYSLSPELDSIKQRQLCKVFTIVNPHPHYDKERDINADGFTAMHEMKVIPVADKDTAAIMAIFRRDKWRNE
jgi:hypothetical protein